MSYSWYKNWHKQNDLADRFHKSAGKNKEKSNYKKRTDRPMSDMGQKGLNDCRDIIKSGKLTEGNGWSDNYQQARYQEGKSKGVPYLLEKKGRGV